MDLTLGAEVGKGSSVPKEVRGGLAVIIKAEVG